MGPSLCGHANRQARDSRKHDGNPHLSACQPAGEGLPAMVERGIVTLVAPAKRDATLVAQCRAFKKLGHPQLGDW